MQCWKAWLTLLQWERDLYASAELRVGPLPDGERDSQGAVAWRGLVSERAGHFPRYHNQRWRFMPEGLKTLLAPFSGVEIVAEDYSIAGLFRSINLFVDTFIISSKARWLFERFFYPAMNSGGRLLHRFSRGDSQFTTNYCCRAKKEGDLVETARPCGPSWRRSRSAVG